MNEHHKRNAWFWLLVTILVLETAWFGTIMILDLGGRGHLALLIGWITIPFVMLFGAAGVMWTWARVALFMGNRREEGELFPANAATTQTRADEPRRRRIAAQQGTLIGCAWALLAIVPVVAACGFFGRIPVPFGGWASGLNAVENSFGVVLLIGIAMGGFPALTVLGGLAGAVVQWRSKSPQLQWVVILTVVTVLDWLLFQVAVLTGPW